MLALTSCEMWELDYKESWVLKNWCFWTVVLEKTLESPLDCKEIQPVHPKGNQSRIFIGILDWCWSSHTLATWCEELTHLKRPWCWERLKAGGEGDDRGWEWMASLSQWTWVWVNSGDGQGGLAYCSPWGCKELGTTEWLNWKGIQTFLSPEVSMKAGKSGQHCQKWCDWMKGKAFPPSVVSTNIHHFV